MRVLGIDPGSRITGYGVVDGEGSRLRCVACGVIKTRTGAPLAQRLSEIHHGVELLLSRHAPDGVALEAVFAARNVRSALVLGQARGAALAVCGLGGHSVSEYTPAEVKMAVVGHGRAAKEQVQHMVRLLLGLERTPVTDAADALAVAICHLQQLPVRAAIADAERRFDEARETAGSRATQRTGARAESNGTPTSPEPRTRRPTRATWRQR